MSMSSLDQRLKELKELERQLELAKKTIQFLGVIVESTENYDLEEYKDVKDRVVSMLKGYVEYATKSIESGGDGRLNSSTLKNKVTKNDEAKASDTESVYQTPESLDKPKEIKSQVKKDTGLTSAEKIAFAMENRHLATKFVKFNISGESLSGTVIALDAPLVVVQTEDKTIYKINREDIEV